MNLGIFYFWKTPAAKAAAISVPAVLYADEKGGGRLGAGYSLHFAASPERALEYFPAETKRKLAVYRFEKYIEVTKTVAMEVRDAE
jgi:hypothetical protein